MSFIIDNSVTMTWCFEDEAVSAMDVLLKRVIDSGAIAPGLWPLEAANALLMAERRGRMNARDRKTKINFLRQLPIICDAHSSTVVWEAVIDLAAQHRLTTYDAAYLELALRRDLPLATLDRDLRKAAKAEGVEVLV